MNEERKAEALAQAVNSGINLDEFTVEEYEWDLILRPVDPEAPTLHVIVDGGWGAHYPEGKD
jgi:hypothetical protein